MLYMFYTAKLLCAFGFSTRLGGKYLEAARRRFPQSKHHSAPFYTLYEKREKMASGRPETSTR